LFVTLDPLVRKVKLPDRRELLVSDTVGFIDRLPHSLVAAFRATLEEVAGADLLLHVVDIAPLDGTSDPVADARAIVKELKRYDQALFDKPRWLVLNKLDLVAPEERAQRVAAFVDAYRWAGPVSAIAAINGEGCRELVYAIQDWLEKHPAENASALAE
jgi:GTP-binding protein